MLTNVEKGQLVILSDSEDKPLFFAYVAPTSEKVIISGETIALGLIWVNPYIILFDEETKKEFIDGVVTSTLFPQLVDKIDALLLSDPKNLLHPTAHPEIVKTAFATVKFKFDS